MPIVGRTPCCCFPQLLLTLLLLLLLLLFEWLVTVPVLTLLLVVLVEDMECFAMDAAAFPFPALTATIASLEKMWTSTSFNTAKYLLYNQAES